MDMHVSLQDLSPSGSGSGSVLNAMQKVVELGVRSCSNALHNEFVLFINELRSGAYWFARSHMHKSRQYFHERIFK